MAHTWVDIYLNDYGSVGKLTVEENGTAVDISGYTTRQFVFRQPDGTTVTKTATFDTDGTDGVLKYTIEDGLFDVAGTWTVRAVLSATGTQLTSSPISFVVRT